MGLDPRLRQPGDASAARLTLASTRTDDFNGMSRTTHLFPHRSGEERIADSWERGDELSTTGEHPPIDPALRAALEARTASEPTAETMAPSELPRSRSALAAQFPTDDLLGHRGTVEVEERSIPGPQHAPGSSGPDPVARQPQGRLPCLY